MKQERQADEPEAVQKEEWSQGVSTRVAAQLRPDVPRCDKPPGDEAEGDTGSVQSQLEHHGLLDASNVAHPVTAFASRRKSWDRQEMFKIIFARLRPA